MACKQLKSMKTTKNGGGEGGGILHHGNCRQIEINTNWQKFGLFKKGPVKKGRRQKTDNMFRASVCLKIAGEKKEDDLMFNELSFNFN